jgi:hypothetical protein
MPLNLPASNMRGANPIAAFRLPGWIQAQAFIFGFCLQFNFLLGGNGEGVDAQGGYGFRALDFLSVAAIALLLFHAFSARRVLTLAIFSAVIGAMALLRMQEPTFWSDPRTATLGLHYLAYSLAGLYLAIICNDDSGAQGFCWGLTLGLVATIPIFAFQALGYSSSLVQMGLVPGYHAEGGIGSAAVARYSGLWGHPNQAGHIAALAGAAGAYFAFNRRYIPAAVVAVSLIVVFYYTESRGGLIAGASVLAIAVLFPRGKRLNLLHLAIAGVVVTIAVELLLQIEFIAYRFEADPAAASNFSERLGSASTGIQLALSNPLGLSLDVYASEMESIGGVATPHNGFITFVSLFGIVPFVALVLAFAANLRIRRDADVFFFFLTIQVSVSFFFEQLPVDYDYALIICMLFGQAFLRSRIGSDLQLRRSKITSGKFEKSRLARS